jgi:hypothetical protein
MALVLSYDTGWRLKSLSSPDNTDDIYIADFLSFRKTGRPEYISDTIEIYKDPMLRLFIECMLLSGFSDDECLEFFGCSASAIVMYKKMYFDIEPVSGSLAKLIMVAKNGTPNEQSLKLCAVRFGKQFVRWFIGLDSNLDDEFLASMKSRIDDGIVLKTLGHEFVGSTSPDMNMYMRMISHINKSKKDCVGSDNMIKDIVGHFSGIMKDKYLPE